MSRPERRGERCPPPTDLEPGHPTDQSSGSPQDVIGLVAWSSPALPCRDGRGSRSLGRVVVLRQERVVVLEDGERQCEQVSLQREDEVRKRGWVDIGGLGVCSYRALVFEGEPGLFGFGIGSISQAV